MGLDDEGYPWHDVRTNEGVAIAKMQTTRITEL
jgi:hypothetical protein